MPNPPNIFEPLQCIGEDLYLYEPSNPPFDDGNGPSLIVLFTWLGGATAKRISKYLSSYRAIWPATTILLVTTRLFEFAAAPSSALRARLKPAREVLRRHLVKEEAKPSVLFHVFSNGGLHTAIHLVLSLRYPKENTESLDLRPHIRGIIIDCCPGQTDYMRTYNGAIVSLPPTLLGKLFGKPLLFLAVSLSTSLTHVGLVNGVKDYRRQLNDPSVFGSSARRLYLYAKGDPVVGYEDVESHIEDAKEKGHEVDSVRFSNSHHCSLPRGNEVQYWDAIMDFWERLSISEHSQPPSRL